MAKIAIVGCGTIGIGWAVTFARAGHRVSLFDPVFGRGASAARQAREILAELDLLPGTRDVAECKLIPTGDLADAVEDADYVQESVPEECELKASVFAELDKLAPRRAILASSTSAIMPSQFLTALPGRDRCLVAHPFNPPYLIPLVEVVPSEYTSNESVSRCVALLGAAGQAPILLNAELEGFIGNRLQAAVVNEAMYLVGAGYASPEAIDQCMRDGLGRRWVLQGPFETMDLNAQGGFADYVSKFGASYQELGGKLGVAMPWRPEAVALVEQARRGHTPANGLAAAQARRDRGLLRLAKWLSSEESAAPLLKT